MIGQNVMTNQFDALIDSALQNVRRTYDLKDIVKAFEPQESVFFTLLTNFAKDPTPDPVFKMLESRPIWHRRHFYVAGYVYTTTTSTTVLLSGAQGSGGTPAQINTLYLVSSVSPSGIELGSNTWTAPVFLVPGEVIMVRMGVTPSGSSTAVTKQAQYRVTNVQFRSMRNNANSPISSDQPSNAALLNGGAFETNNYTVPVAVVTVSFIGLTDGSSVDGTTVSLSSVSSQRSSDRFGQGMVIGSLHAQGGRIPKGYGTELSMVEGYVGIFKNATRLFSGTAMATEYRGRRNEFIAGWRDLIKQHKLDIERALHFGIGRKETTLGGTGGVSAITDLDESNGVYTYTWGIIPYIERFGKVHTLYYNQNGYDQFVDLMAEITSPEFSSGSNEKTVLCSLNVLSWLNKLGSGSFLQGSIGSGAYRLDVQNIQTQFGFTVTTLSNNYGKLHFVPDIQLKYAYKDSAVIIDMDCVKYRPLVGNGLSRDTFIKTNVQNNDVDGRRDAIITEAGLQINMVENHRLLHFTTAS